MKNDPAPEREGFYPLLDSMRRVINYQVSGEVTAILYEKC